MIAPTNASQCVCPRHGRVQLSSSRYESCTVRRAPEPAAPQDQAASCSVTTLVHSRSSSQRQQKARRQAKCPSLSAKGPSSQPGHGSTRERNGRSSSTRPEPRASWPPHPRWSPAPPAALLPVARRLTCPPTDAQHDVLDCGGQSARAGAAWLASQRRRPGESAQQPVAWHAEGGAHPPSGLSQPPPRRPPRRPPPHHGALTGRLGLASRSGLPQPATLTPSPFPRRPSC